MFKKYSIFLLIIFTSNLQAGGLNHHDNNTVFQNLYIGAGLVFSDINNDIPDNANINMVHDDDHSYAPKIILGYQINDTYSIEGSYLSMRNSRNWYQGGGATLYGGKLDIDIYNIFLNFKLPLNLPINIDLKIGANFIVLEERNTAFPGAVTVAKHHAEDVSYGISISKSLKKNLLIRFDLEEYGNMGISGEAVTFAPSPIAPRAMSLSFIKKF
jgi:hypothetical protein